MAMPLFIFVCAGWKSLPLAADAIAAMPLFFAAAAATPAANIRHYFATGAATLR